LAWLTPAVEHLPNHSSGQARARIPVEKAFSQKFALALLRPSESESWDVLQQLTLQLAWAAKHSIARHGEELRLA
jgi:hypothetical protein